MESTILLKLNSPFKKYYGVRRRYLRLHFRCYHKSCKVGCSSILLALPELRGVHPTATDYRLMMNHGPSKATPLLFNLSHPLTPRPRRTFLPQPNQAFHRSSRPLAATGQPQGAKKTTGFPPHSLCQRTGFEDATAPNLRGKTSEFVSSW